MIGHGLRLAWWGLTWIGRRLLRPPRYVKFLLETAPTELPPARRPFWQRRLIARRVPPDLLALGQAFRTIASDPRVEGVILHLRPFSASPAVVEGMLDALAELRRAGRQVVIWAPALTTSTYHIATGADRVLLQPGGHVGPLGYGREFLFLGDALRRIGVEPQFVAVSPYKTAADPLTRGSLSEAGREMETWLLNSRHAAFVSAVAAARGLDPATLGELLDRSPLTAQEALEAGLVDGLSPEHELPERLGLDGRAGIPPEWPAARRRILPLPPVRPGGAVAVLPVSGMIVEGRGSNPPVRPPLPIPFLPGQETGDLGLVEQVRALKRNKRVKAVVLHIDSPGGSALASEVMASALEDLARVKPLVAVMGSVAASGGYYVATPCGWIVARPGTLTGSIGVLAGRIATEGALRRLSINDESLFTSEGVASASAFRPLSPAQIERLRASVEDIYARFLSRVVAARGLEMTRLREELAGGRVWTGEQALERGLVDQLGGLREGVEKARELAGLARTGPVWVWGRSAAPSLAAPAPMAWLEGIWSSLRMLGSEAPLALCWLHEWQ